MHHQHDTVDMPESRNFFSHTRWAGQILLMQNIYIQIQSGLDHEVN